MIELPELPYSLSALEPVLSARTLELHHGKHHAKYVEGVNAHAAGGPAHLEDILREAAQDPKLRQNAGQAWNHSFFWNCMTPAGLVPRGALAAAIRAEHDNVERLRGAFIEAGSTHFGSGWVWLLASDGGALSVETTHDDGTMAVDTRTPLLVCDLWEHAYYLDHQNDRAGFLAGWWDKLVNWEFAEAQYRAALGHRQPWIYDEGSRPQPLRDRDAFDRALEGVTRALADPLAARSREDRRLGVLLEQVADYHESRNEPVGATDRQAFEHLDQRLRAFEIRWPKRPPLEGAHWAPALGGELPNPDA